MGFDHFYVGPELEYFLFRDNKGTEVLDEGGYFDLTTLDAGSDVRRDTVLALEKLGIQVEYSHHEVGPSQHEIDMRYADALKMADDCMTYRITVKEIRAEVRLARDVHAQAAVRGERLGHAHAPVAVQGRRATRSTTPTTATSSPTSARRSSPASCATRARSELDLRPVGELLQAPGAGLRGPDLRGLVAPQPLRARARAALPPGQGAGHADGAALPGPGVQPVPDLRGAAAGRTRGHREGLRAARADGEEPLPPVARRARAARDRAAARRRSARRSS